MWCLFSSSPRRTIHFAEVAADYTNNVCSLYIKRVTVSKYKSFTTIESRCEMVSDKEGKLQITLTKQQHLYLVVFWA